MLVYNLFFLNFILNGSQIINIKLDFTATSIEWFLVKRSSNSIRSLFEPHLLNSIYFWISLQEIPLRFHLKFKWKKVYVRLVQINQIDSIILHNILCNINGTIKIRPFFL